MSTRRATLFLLAASLALTPAATCFGLAQPALAAPQQPRAAVKALEPAPDAATSCAALSKSAPEAADTMDKIHAVLEAVSPALPHPDRPELETGDVDVLELLLRSDDLHESIDRLGEELRAARRRIVVEDLGIAVDNLARQFDDLRDSVSDDNMPNGNLAKKEYPVVADTVRAFQRFQALYLKRCGITISPRYETGTDGQRADDETPSAEE